MKQTLLSLLLVITVIDTNVLAQPQLSLQKTIGGNSTDNLTSEFFTKDGGLILAGSSFSNISGDKTENSRGDLDYWIVKLDKHGNIQWDKTIGGSDNDQITVIQQTTDGGYILGGFSSSNISGEKTQNSRGNSDYWVVKLDATHNIQWSKTIGGSSFDVLNTLQQTTDGGYILGGSSNSNISGEKTENSRGSYDYWVVKLDNLGNILWNKTIGAGAEDYLNSIQQTTDGGYILGGTSNSNISGEKTENSRGGFEDDYWVVKLTGAGAYQWDKTIGGIFSDKLTVIQQTPDGGYILGGYSTSDRSGEKTENSRGFADYWIVRLDGAHNILWDKTIGGNDNDRLNALQQTSDGGFILGGASSSNISGEKTENSRGGYDYWVVKLDAAHNIQWNKTAGGSDVDQLFAIKEVAKNQYALGGYSSSNISGDKKQGSQGGTDYWILLLKYVKPFAQNIISNAEKSNSIITSKNFKAYPNPAKDELYIECADKNIFSLINQAGKILFTKTINGKAEINVTNLAAGFYYLKNDKAGETQKVAIIK